MLGVSNVFEAFAQDKESAKVLASEEIIYQVFLDLRVREVELVLHGSGRAPELKL